MLYHLILSSDLSVNDVVSQPRADIAELGDPNGDLPDKVHLAAQELVLQEIEVIICTRFGLYSVRTDSAQFLTFELVHSFCLFFDLLASRDEVDQDFVNITSGKSLCSRFRH